MILHRFLHPKKFTSKKYVLATLVAVLLVGQSMPAGAILVEPLPEYAPVQGDKFLKSDVFFQRTVLQEALSTSRFLQQQKNGLPYTPDSRDLQNDPEEIRLLVVSQVLGYLNLYTVTRSNVYRQEAISRLEYILSQGDRVFHHSNFDGQLGYAYLRAYAVLGDQRYKTEGLRIAGECISAEHNNMNAGYMCAMALGQAYTLTQNSAYRSASRAITRNTGDKQFPNGAFPHRDSLVYGENTSYTAWIVNEMLYHRVDDPQNPDMDHAILNAARFLEQRVNRDGSINYEDALGSYYDDPGNMDSRGWLNDPAYIALVLHAVGKDAAAKRTLQFLFQKQGNGAFTGSYPDKWAFIESGNIWQTGNPSMVRTSIIFWTLTEIALPPTQSQCTSGQSSPCTVTPTNCHPALQELGLCSVGLTGTRSCIDGKRTACLNAEQITYVPDLCVVRYSCQYNEDMGMSSVYSCTNIESRKCVGEHCSSWCTDASRVEPTCTFEQYQGDSCQEAPAALSAIPHPNNSSGICLVAD